MTPNTPSAETRIELRQVCKDFVGIGEGASRCTVHALRGVDLVVDQPGFFGIMGKSGSGKSTLLHLLAGLDRPDSGEILVGGIPIHSLDEGALTLYRRKSIGVIFQQFNLIPTLDALANTILPGVLDRQERGQLEARGISLLKELGVGHRAHHRPEALSGGEQQRVAIARALLFEPPVILADEPTGSLDSTSSASLWRVLEETAMRRNLIVLMVTHEPTAATHCHRTFILQDGRVAGDFPSHGLDPSQLAHRASKLARQA